MLEWVVGPNRATNIAHALFDGCSTPLTGRMPSSIRIDDSTRRPAGSRSNIRGGCRSREGEMDLLVRKKVLRHGPINQVSNEVIIRSVN